MTPEEIHNKTVAAKSVGTVVFLTQEELTWLSDICLQYAIRLGGDGIMEKDRNTKVEFLLAVTIGLKCAQASGEL
jgi:hypothetical protein